MLLAFLALTTLNQTPATVTYTNPGARLERLLPGLSKATGLDLAPAKELKDVVLCMRLDHADVSKTLDAVAYASWGRWQHVGDGYLLIPDPSPPKLEPDNYDNELLRLNITEHAQALLRFVRGEGKSVADLSLPGAWAVEQLLPSLNLDQLTIAGMSDELIFSTQPRPLQHGLPPGAEEIFEEMILRLAAKSTPQDFVSNRTPHKTDLFIRTGMPFLDTDSRTVGGLGDLPGLNFEIVSYDDSGKAVAATSGILPGPQDWSSTPRAEPPPPDRRNVPWSDATKANMSAWPGGAPLTPTMREAIENPVEHDPDAWAGSLAVDLANFTGQQMVVALDDSALSWVGFEEPHTVEDMLHMLRLPSLPSGPWMTRRIPRRDPNDWISSFYSWPNQDRAKLQKLVRDWSQINTCSLEHLIEATRLGLGSDFRMPQARLLKGGDLTLTFSKFIVNITIRDDFTWLQPASFLSEKQAAALVKGETVSIGMPSAELRKLIVEKLTQMPEYEQPLLFGATPFRRRSDARGEVTEVIDTMPPSGATMFLVHQDSFPAIEEFSHRGQKVEVRSL